MSMISVYNNGRGIPIKIHEDLNVCMPEMLIGQELIISFIADLKRFGMTELTDDAIALLSKHVYDIAEAKREIEAFLDGERIEVRKSLVDVQKVEDAKNAGTR